MNKEEIVGLVINGKFICGWEACAAFKDNNCKYDRYITRVEAQAMAEFDATWEKFVNGPVIMIMDEQGLRLPEVKNKPKGYTRPSIG